MTYPSHINHSHTKYHFHHLNIHKLDQIKKNTTIYPELKTGHGISYSNNPSSLAIFPHPPLTPRHGLSSADSSSEAVFNKGAGQTLMDG